MSAASEIRDDLAKTIDRVFEEHCGKPARESAETGAWPANLWRALEEVGLPLASLPAPIAGRNRMLRRLLIDSVREDPKWRGGHYEQQPQSLRRALAWFNAASNGGTLALQRLAPTRQAADRLIEHRLSQPIDVDANDLVYQWDSSRDYDPSGSLHLIQAKVLAILSEDDERSTEAALRHSIAKVRNGRMHVIPESADTCGHATVGNATLWIEALKELLDICVPA